MNHYLVASRATPLSIGLLDSGNGTLGALGRSVQAYLCNWTGGGGGNSRDIAKAMAKTYMTTETNGAKGGGRDTRAMRTRRERLTRPLRILLSYHYYKDEDLDALLGACFEGMTIDVFADSGAWSAWSIGQPVDEGKYIAWIERWQHIFTVAAGPDVIGDAAATQAATARMLDRVKGIPILPVFHVGEDYGRLAEYAAMSSYIAFGGMVPFAKNRKLLRSWVQKAFRHTPEGTRVHGFGMTTWPLLVEFPWFSVDSSSWTSGFRYAQITLFDEQRGAITSISMNDSSALLQHGKLLESYGLRSGDMHATKYDRDLLCGALVESWQKAEAWLERRKSAGGGPFAAYLAAGSIYKGGHGDGHVTSIGNGIRRVVLDDARPGTKARGAEEET